MDRHSDLYIKGRLWFAFAVIIINFTLAVAYRFRGRKLMNGNG